MRVGFISSDFSSTLENSDGSPVLGGACHYRCHLPAKYMEQNGIDTVLTEQFRTKNGVIQPIDYHGNVYNCDIIVCQRWMVQGADQVIHKARATGQIILQDVDDYFWGLNPSNQAWYNTHPKYNPIANLNHYEKALQASSGVIVSTDYLKEKLAKFHEYIYIIPNAIELAAFNPKPFVPEKPVLGWTGSTQHRSGDLEILKGVLGPFLERHDLRFFHLGHVEGVPSFADLAGLPPERVRTAPLMPMDTYPSYFAQFDLEVVPLADNAFNKSKSSIKGMEAAAAGVPYLSSSTPEYDKLNLGPVCKRPKDWIKNLEILLDPNERRILRQRGLERIQDYDIKTRWKDWSDLFLQLGEFEKKLIEI